MTGAFMKTSRLASSRPAGFTVHKGEVELKAQVVVWGPQYRVDVWSRALLGRRVRKTWWSRVTEREIQEEIERRLPLRAGEPIVAPDATLRVAPVNVGRSPAVE